MRGLFAFLTLLVTLIVSLPAFLLGFLAHVARIAWALGVDSARWVLDPYPAEEGDDLDRPDDDRAPAIGSPRTHAEVLAEVARRNAKVLAEVARRNSAADQAAAVRDFVPGRRHEQEVGAFPLDEVAVADHTHSFTPTTGGGVRCTLCGFAPPTL